MQIRIDCADKHVRTMLKQLLRAGLDAADPESAIRRAVRVRNNRLRVGAREYDLAGFSRIVCIGAGKASGVMAAALERQVGSRLEGGLVVVNDGHVVRTKRIQLLEARHPVPDHRSEKAARRMILLLESLSERALVLMVLSGGELTVTVKGKGIRARAQEFALAAAPSIAGLSGVCVAGFGTDGIDGSTEAAGAIVDGRTISLAKKKGVSLEAALRENDSYEFFHRVGGHVVTGPTGTNVNDVYMILVLGTKV